MSAPYDGVRTVIYSFKDKTSVINLQYVISLAVYSGQNEEFVKVASRVRTSIRISYFSGWGPKDKSKSMKYSDLNFVSVWSYGF